LPGFKTGAASFSKNFDMFIEFGHTINILGYFLINKPTLSPLKKAFWLDVRFG